jgi:hypothetical protein
LPEFQLRFDAAFLSLFRKTQSQGAKESDATTAQNGGDEATANWERLDFLAGMSLLTTVSDASEQVPETRRLDKG